MSVERDHVRVIDVGVGTGLAVATEGFLERPLGGGGAQSRVAVHVIGAQSAVTDHGQRVVLLQQQLAAGVEADRTRTEITKQRLGSRHDPIHRGVPVGFDQPVVVAYQRYRQPIG